MKFFLRKIKKYKLNRGMTYVELIVVLSIFSIFSGMAIFNYKGFQGKVDIKNLANEMALQIVEAQKSALNGKLPPSNQQSSDLNWKPSYGIYFNLSSGPNTGNKVFYYFVDTNSDKDFNHGVYTCPHVGECVDRINITKGNFISLIESFNNGSYSAISGPVSITFTRPNSGAVFYTNAPLSAEYIRITLSSASDTETFIKIFPSGRVELSDNDQ